MIKMLSKYKESITNIDGVWESSSSASFISHLISYLVNDMTLWTAFLELV
jgi:hypothetical protein